MIDNDDVEFVALAGPVGLIGLIIFCFFLYFACQNEKECASRTCPNGQQAKLMENACLCVTEAK